MDMSRDVRDSPENPSEGGRFRSVAKIAVLDIAAPAGAYSVLRSAGMSAVIALIWSGVFPAIGVAIGIVQHRRLDVVGALVLAGIIVGAVLGLASGNARLVLVEGSVPTAVFGLACLGSLRTARPLMFGFALEFIGPTTAKGREMTGLWPHPGFRHVFRVITAVWGIGFLIEAAVRVVIVEHTSTGTALASSKAMPFLVAAILGGWTAAYGAQQRRKGERMAAATGEVAQASRIQAPPPETTKGG